MRRKKVNAIDLIKLELDIFPLTICKKVNADGIKGTRFMVRDLSTYQINYLMDFDNVEIDIEPIHGAPHVIIREVVLYDKCLKKGGN